MVSRENIEGENEAGSAATKPAPTRTAVPAEDVIEIAGSLQGLTPEHLEQRRRALLNMLRSSLQRHEMALRQRRPVFSAGLAVQVIAGPHVGAEGVIDDADYIEQRALVDTEEDGMLWLPFHQLAGFRED